MKTKALLIALALVLSNDGVNGQGTIIFNNNSSSLVSAYGVPTPPITNGFYFGLFIAPPGTTDPRAFTFTGNYATNSTVNGAAGRLMGGLQTVPGWAPGQPMAYLVRGWDSSLGHDWNSEWLQGYASPYLFGQSLIANGLFAGGNDGLFIYPSWFLFGGTGIPGGMGLERGFLLIPEPSTTSLVIVGFLAIQAPFGLRRRKFR